MTVSELPDWTENQPRAGWLPSLQLGDFWTSRELAYFFFVRDLKSTYKQTLLGVVWVLLGPLTGALSYTFVFNGLAGVETEGSYFALALTGFIVWTFISGTMGDCAESLLEHEDLITHVSFPMIAAPVSVVLGALVNLAVGSLVALGWAVLTWSFPSIVGVAIGLPLGLLLMILTALGPGLFFAPALVKYRDSGAFLGILLQAMFFLGSVAYPPDLIGDRFQTLLYLNPVTGAVTLFRWALTPTSTPDPGQIAISFAVALVLFLLGLLSFRRNEDVLVDVI